MIILLLSVKLVLVATHAQWSHKLPVLARPQLTHVLTLNNTYDFDVSLGDPFLTHNLFNYIQHDYKYKPTKAEIKLNLYIKEKTFNHFMNSHITIFGL